MIIFVYGEDSYSALAHLEAMRERFVEKFDPSGMNVAEFSGKLEVGPISQALQSPGFMSDKRMVIVKGLLSQVTRKPDAKPWVEQLNRIPSETIAIFFDDLSEKKVEKNEIFKQLSQKDDFHTYTFPVLTGAGLSKWSSQEAARLKLRISPALLSRVVALVGSDLWQLSGELKKISSYSNGAEVTDEMIELLVKANFEDRMFDFVDAVALRDGGRALKLLNEQRESGSTDFHLFSMIARQVRLLIGARDVLEGNPRATKQDVAQALGVHPFVAQKTLAQARAFSAEHLARLHELVFSFDKRVKTGGSRIEIAVDRVVAEMV